MRAEAVCDACFGLMVREDRTPTPGHHTIPCATRPPTPNHPTSPKGHSTAVYYAHPKITTAMKIRMTLITMLMSGWDWLDPRSQERLEDFEGNTC